MISCSQREVRFINCGSWQPKAPRDSGLWANPKSAVRCLLACAMAWLVLAIGVCAPSNFAVATFKVDVTPPPGSPLCDALVPPATGVNDPLSARGIVIEADKQKPMVLVAFDWVGIGNEGHDAFCKAIARGLQHSGRPRLRSHAPSARCAGL